MPAFGKRWVALLLFWMAVVLMAHGKGKDPEITEEVNPEWMKMDQILLRDTSLVPPFFEDRAGLQNDDPITDTFIMTPDARISYSFIRLIEDDGSVLDSATKCERSGLVSKEGIGELDGGFSAFLKFRLTGSNRDGIGVALGLSFATKPIEIQIERSFKLGELNNSINALYSTDEPFNFEGFAVIVDTSTNKYPRTGNVIMVYNNGKMSFEDMQVKSQYCTADFHYWEDRDDVHVTSASQLRLKYRQGTVNLEIDQNNSGTWIKCCSMGTEGLPPNFSEIAHVGLASVRRGGEGTCNVDVLGLRIYGEDVFPEVDVHLKQNGKHDPYDTLIHHMEHEALRMFNIFSRTIEKLHASQEKNQEKIQLLEGEFEQKIMDRLEERLVAMESGLRERASSSVNTDASFMAEYVLGHVDSFVNELSQSKVYYYIIPLIGIIVATVGAYIFSFVKYKELKKAHLC